MYRISIMLLIILLPIQVFGEARCKVNGQWYPYSHPNCKSNTLSTSNFVMFKIVGGKFSPCVRVIEVENLEKARTIASAFTGVPNCRVSSEDNYINALCQGNNDANVLFAPDMQSCERLRADYQKVWDSKKP